MQVRATFNYLAPGFDAPVTIWPAAGEGDAIRLADYDTHCVDVSDARQKPTGLDREGFVIRSHTPAAIDFLDPRAVAATYYKEVAELIRGEVGSCDIVPLGHTARSSDPNQRKSRRMRETVNLVHADFTERSVQRILAAAKDSHGLEWAGRRHAIVQTWQPLRGRVTESPLALCDARSVDVSRDLVRAEQRKSETVTEIFHVRFNEGHQWYFFPGMSADEILLFKGFDSATDGRARFTIHSAFPLRQEAEMTPRESIDTRMLVLF